MTAILIDDNTKDGKVMIDFLRNMEYVTFIDEPQTDWWDTISDAERQSILRGLKDVEEGRVYSHEEVMKPYEQWL
ncbi:hypothetical protein FACS189411_05870 [Bacteroidia bacterium]|nr:hypothetical protein FACS189411_05870 [Bacteroidia bacterium]